MFLKSLSLFSLLLFSTACSDKSLLLNDITEKKDQVVYGEDDRVDYFNSSSIHEMKMSEASVGIFLSSDLDEVSDYYYIQRSYLGQEYGLCSRERFFYQSVGPRCSGVLVANDLVLTAAHCIQDQAACENDSLKFNFDYKLKNSFDVLDYLKKSETYSCKRLLYHSDSFQEDFALIQLDRPVSGHAPVQSYQKLEQTNQDNKLAMLGHPLGLPQKIARGGKLRRWNNYSGIIEIDAFSGNSGSAVYNEDTGALVGILSKGETDFEKEENGCLKVRRCTSGDCSGEVVYFLTKLREIIERYKVDKNQSFKKPVPQRPAIFSSFFEEEIPDGSYQGLSSKLRVNMLPEGKNVYIGVKIQHEWIGDLKISVVTPEGKEVLLRNREVWKGKTFEGLFGINLVSASSLSSLKEVKEIGEWTLKIVDTSRGDKGQLLNWRVVYK
ncbi:MAG: trypsin-like peptidase domain-containing protein [Bdellovibrionota bacterium]|nr:trypsin-like peptidase domain-containing protein [Bdellovibrionota bacterium]